MSPLTRVLFTDRRIRYEETHVRFESIEFYILSESPLQRLMGPWYKVRAQPKTFLGASRPENTPTYALLPTQFVFFVCVEINCTLLLARLHIV